VLLRHSIIVGSGREGDHVGANAPKVLGARYRYHIRQHLPEEEQLRFSRSR
jgi:hypothetical protein